MIGLPVRGVFATSLRGYLDTPSMGVPPRAAVRRMREELDRWARGQASFDAWERDGEACRRRFARGVGVGETEVALVHSVALPAAAVAEALAKRGGAVVAHVSEYRSLLLPFLARFGQDRVRFVDGPYTASTFTPAIGHGVAAVVVSSVSSADGARPDMAAIVEASSAADAIVVVDATQSAGTVPLGVPTDSLGAMFAAGYKGLLGPRGTAYAYIRPDVGASPFVVPSPYGMADAAEKGAYGPPLQPMSDTRALDQSPAWLSWVGALPALEWLDSCPEPEREGHSTALAEMMRSGLMRLGLQPQATDWPSPLVSVDVARPQAANESLAAAGIRAAVRRGRLRFGFHRYNTTRDVSGALAVLASLSIHPSPKEVVDV